MLLGLGPACGSEPAASPETEEGEAESEDTSSVTGETAPADMGVECPPKDVSVQIVFNDFESEGLNVQEACTVDSSTVHAS